MLLCIISVFWFTVRCRTVLNITDLTELLRRIKNSYPYHSHNYMVLQSIRFLVTITIGVVVHVCGSGSDTNFYAMPQFAEICIP
jgi:hypothetical protein